MKLYNNVLLAMSLFAVPTIIHAMDAPLTASAPLAVCAPKRHALLIKLDTIAQDESTTLDAYRSVAQEIYEQRFEIGIRSLQNVTLRENEDLSAVLAALNGHTKILGKLIAQNANLNPADGLPIIFAAGAGHTEIVKLLLAAGVKATSEALRAALSKGYAEIAYALIAHSTQAFIDDYDSLVKMAPKYMLVAKKKGEEILSDPLIHHTGDETIYVRMESGELLADAVRSIILVALVNASQARDVQAYKAATKNFYKIRGVFKHYDMELINAMDALDFALLIALKFGHTDMEAALLKQGASSTIVKLEAIRDAIRTESIDSCMALIKECLADILEEDSNSDTRIVVKYSRKEILTFALYASIWHNALKIIRQLVTRVRPTFNVDVKNTESAFGKFSKTPYEFAVELIKHNREKFITHYLEMHGGK